MHCLQNITFSCLFDLLILMSSLWDNKKTQPAKKEVCHLFRTKTNGPHIVIFDIVTTSRRNLISGLKVWIGKMRKGKLSCQNSINRSVKLFQMKCKTLRERKAVNKKWSSFSFLLQTEPDEKPNKGINSTENSFDTFSYL